MPLNSTRKLITVGIVSNILEWYDFVIYGFLAAAIGYHFFSSDTHAIAFIKAWFVFSISYLIRPIGSIVLGSLADRYGQSKALRISLLLMAIPAFLIGLLPSYHQAGTLATLGLVVLRLIQGFGAGGELPGSACYLYETAPPTRRFFFCSIVAVSSMTGVLVGSGVITILYFLFSEDAVLQWAWRLPFLLGFLVAIVIFWIRTQLLRDEASFSKPSAKSKIPQAFKKNLPAVFQVMALNAFISVTFYLLFVWMPSYLHVFLNMDQKLSSLISTIGLAALILSTLLCGIFASSLGSRRLFLLGLISVLVLAYPLLHWIQQGGFTPTLVAILLFAVCFGTCQSANFFILASLFPPVYRGRGASISYTFITSLLGGTAPTICSYLIEKTHSNSSPLLFLLITGLIAFPVAYCLPKNEASSNFRGIDDTTTQKTAA